MRTFSEWVKENHPGDELLKEFFGDLARRAANTKAGRSAILAAAVGLGPMASKASAITPPVPAGMQQSYEQGYYSNVPFNKKLFVHLAPKMGIDPQRAAEMDDFDAWLLMMKKVNIAERRVSRNRGESYPDWYIKMGFEYNPRATMDVRSWRPPAPPKVNAADQLGSIGGIK